jgi:hypothetical protein
MSRWEIAIWRKRRPKRQTDNLELPEQLEHRASCGALKSSGDRSGPERVTLFLEEISETGKSQLDCIKLLVGTSSGIELFSQPRFSVFSFLNVAPIECILGISLFVRITAKQ